MTEAEEIDALSDTLAGILVDAIVTSLATVDIDELSDDEIASLMVGTVETLVDAVNADTLIGGQTYDDETGRRPSDDSGFGIVGAREQSALWLASKEHGTGSAGAQPD
jgi:hypothetical protein